MVSSNSNLVNDNIDLNNNIHIALALDKVYAVHVYALLTSIFHNNRSHSFFFHVIATGITGDQVEEITRYIEENGSKIFFYEVDEKALRKRFYIHSHYSVATYYRLFFPSLINAEIKKLLYIDCDTVVIRDLKKLYDTELGAAPLAAVPDPITLIRSELGIYKTEDYFNAGVMLMHLENWRNQRVTENAMKFLADNPEKTTLLLEQDALNATLIGRWLRLDNKFNFTWLAKYLQIPTEQLLKDVVIVHYITENKPWFSLTRNKFRYLYHYYLKKSPKSNEKKYVDFKWGVKEVWEFTRMRIKEIYFDKKINKILPIKAWMEISADNY